MTDMVWWIVAFAPLVLAWYMYGAGWRNGRWDVYRRMTDNERMSWDYRFREEIHHQHAAQASRRLESLLPREP